MHENTVDGTGNSCIHGRFPQVFTNADPPRITCFVCIVDIQQKVTETVFTKKLRVGKDGEVAIDEMQGNINAAREYFSGGQDLERNVPDQTLHLMLSCNLCSD